MLTTYINDKTINVFLKLQLIQLFIFLPFFQYRQEKYKNDLKSEKRGSNSRPSDWKSDALPTELFSQRDTILLNLIIKIFFGLCMLTHDQSRIVFVGVEGIEPPTHEGYLIYSQAPSQLEHYSHIAHIIGLEPMTLGFGDPCSNTTELYMYSFN